MDFKIISSYSQSLELPSSGIPIVASEVRGYTPSQLISFVDLANSIIENNPQYNLYEKVYPLSGVFPFEYVLPEKFRGYGSGVLIVTDRSTESKYVDFNIPLYYQYQLMYDAYIMDPALIDSFILIRKNMESVVNADNYIFETRLYPTASGRYNTQTDNEYLWGSRPISGNVITGRLLLPVRENDYFYTVEYNQYLNRSITEYHNELVYEKKLYNEIVDYTITPSSILLTAASSIGSGVPIFVQRDPTSYIKVKSPSYIDDKVKEKPWNFTISCGSFVHSSGILGGIRNYVVKNNYTSVTPPNQISSAEIPQILNKNILKVNIAPLYDSGSGYPTYDLTGTIISGTINGSDMRGKITSIDYNNGYIYLNQDVKPTDSILLMYAYDDRKTIVVNNMDLNPKNTVNATIDIATDAIGLAVVPSGTVFQNYAFTPVTAWSSVAYYKLSENMTGNFDAGSTQGYALECVTEDLTLGPISGLIPSGSKFIGFFSVNALSKDMVKTYDVRRTGGYTTSDVKNAVSGWRGFSDIGYWDGEAFPLAGTLLIQIPSGVYANIKDIFTNNVVYTEVKSMYSPDLTKKIDRDTQAYDSKEQQIERNTKKYIRDTIERYLPVGYLYIVVDENFDPWPSIRSE